MRAPAPVSEMVLVWWYLDPQRAKSTPKPEVPFNHPSRTLRDEIDLTMQFVTAAQPVFGQGFRNHGVRTVARRSGVLTLFWPVYEVVSERQLRTKETDTGIRTETTIHYYGFDAGRRLMVETVKSHKREDAYENGYSWPFSFMVPRAHRLMLRSALLDFRRDLAS